MKILLLFLMLAPCQLLFSQGTKENLKLGTFGSLQADVGFDLPSILGKKLQTNEYEYRYSNQKTYFTGGFSSQIGYQPLNWLALAGGIRYSYISPMFHNLYWTVQPYFFITKPENLDFGYFTLQIGRQFNKTQGLDDNGFVQVGVGKFDVINNHTAQKFQLSLDVQLADDSIWFLGISYGITFFSNKDL